jgi:hypothetical protein
MAFKRRLCGFFFGIDIHIFCFKIHGIAMLDKVKQDKVFDLSQVGQGVNIQGDCV